MSKKMVLQVDAVSDACKAQAMSAVAKLRAAGVRSMAMDGEKLTVVGDVDVILVAKALRKAKFKPVVLSVGPEKEEEKKPDPPKPGVHCCAGCRSPPPSVAPWPGSVVYCEEQQPGCVIL